MRIFEKAIRSLSLCPIDFGAIALPPLLVLEGAKTANGCAASTLSRPPKRDRELARRASARPRFASLEILCGADNLQCLPSRHADCPLAG